MLPFCVRKTVRDSLSGLTAAFLWRPAKFGGTRWARLHQDRLYRKSQVQEKQKPTSWIECFDIPVLICHQFYSFSIASIFACDKTAKTAKMRLIIRPKSFSASVYVAQYIIGERFTGMNICMV